MKLQFIMLKKFLLLVGIAAIWGSQFILNDEAVQVISPYELAFYRVTFGAIALSLILLLPMVNEPAIKWTKNLVYLLIALTFTESVIPFVMNGFGQQEVSSSVTAVLMASIPLMTIVMDYFINGRPISKMEFLGILVGFSGIVVLVYQDLLQEHDLSLLHVGFILIGAFGFSISLILMGKIPKEVPSLRFTRAILVTSSLVTLPFVFMDNHFSAISTDLWWKLVLLGSFASGIVYYMYLYLVREAGPTFASLNNYLVPVFGIILGVYLNNEIFTTGHYLGFIIILFGLVLVNLQSFKKIKN
ncbi:MAG: DMT family transporter [Flavobacteriaceae bacterium]